MAMGRRWRGGGEGVYAFHHSRSVMASEHPLLDYAGMEDVGLQSTSRGQTSRAPSGKRLVGRSVTRMKGELIPTMNPVYL